MSTENASDALLFNLKLFHGAQVGATKIFEYVFDFTQDFSLKGGMKLRNTLIKGITEVVALPTWDEEAAVAIIHTAVPALFEARLQPTLF